MKKEIETKVTNGTSLPVHAEPEVLVKKRAVVKRLRETAAAILAEAKSLVIKSQVEREAAAEIRARAKAHDAEVDKEFGEPLKVAKLLYDMTRDSVAGMKDDAKAAVKVIEGSMSAWDLAEKERIRKEQEKAERERLEKEERERAKLERKAAVAEEKGDAAKAEELREQAESVQVFSPAAPVQQKMYATASGKSTSVDDFEVVITDVKAVVLALADGRIPPGVLNLTAAFGGGYSEFRVTAAQLKAWGKKQVIGDALPEIPGCKVTRKMAYKGVGR